MAMFAPLSGSAKYTPANIRKKKKQVPARVTPPGEVERKKTATAEVYAPPGVERRERKLKPMPRRPQQID